MPSIDLCIVWGEVYTLRLGTMRRFCFALFVSSLRSELQRDAVTDA